MNLDKNPRHHVVRPLTCRSSWKGLFLGAMLFLSAGAVFAQKSETTTLDFEDRSVKVLVPASVKIEKAEDGGIRATYKVETEINPDSYEDRIFLEVTVTYFKPPKATTAVLDMAPFEKPAVFHVWNTEGKTGYTSFDQSTPTIDTTNITAMDSTEAFSGDIKSIGFSTTLNTDIGEHVVEIHKFTLE